MDVFRVLLGPTETRVSKKGMEPSSLEFSIVKCMWEYKYNIFP